MIPQAKREISSIRTVGKFLNGRACSDTLLNTLNCAFGHPLIGEERAAMPLAGGILQYGYQCGMIWGAALAAGAQAYRLFGAGPQSVTQAILAAQRLVASFNDCHNNINCYEITHIDKSSTAKQMLVYFLVKGGSINCIRMAARFAPVAFAEINSALSETLPKASCAPVSCAAMLAQKKWGHPRSTKLARIGSKSIIVLKSTHERGLQANSEILRFWIDNPIKKFDRFNSFQPKIILMESHTFHSNRKMAHPWIL